MSVLSRPYFHDEAAAFAHLESRLWPVAPICPHCGSVNAKHYDLGKTRMGLRKCCEKGCRKQFTVKVGTVFEQAHIPLNKCLQAVYFMCVSKKGMSAHQLHRTLEISYKAAWFLCHRIREAMRDDGSFDMLGGANQVVEADETYIGGKAKNRAFREPAKKKAVLSLVERDGRVRSFHVANVTAESVKPLIAKNVDKASTLMTDESPVYGKIGKDFALPWHREPQRQRVRSPRRFHRHKRVGELLLDREARHRRHLSQRVRGAPAPLPRGVRLPLQQSLRPWL